MSIKTLLICPYCDNKIPIDMYYEWQAVPTRCEICNHPDLIKKILEYGNDQFGYNKDKEYYANLSRNKK